MMGFSKGTCQHALFKLPKWCQIELDNGGFIGTILMDLSKACYCIRLEVLIAKLECYGLDKTSQINARLPH